MTDSKKAVGKSPAQGPLSTLLKSETVAWFLADRRRDRLAFALLATLIFAVAAAAIAYDRKVYREAGLARLGAIAVLKQQQLGDWLAERQGDVRVLRDNTDLARQYRHWRESGDTASRDRLFARLENLRGNKGYQSLSLLDEDGQPLWTSGNQAPRSDPGRQSAVLQAAAGDNPGPLLGGIEHDVMHFDFIARLAACRT